MDRIDLSNSSLAFDASGLQSRAQGGSQAAVGQFSGQQVEVDDVDSMLSDAAEEISMHHAEKVESKHSAERRKEIRRSLEVMNVEAIMDYLAASQACEDPTTLIALAKRLLAAGSDPAQLVRGTFDEPTSQFMALHYALQQGQREGAPGDALEGLREALEDLEMLHGPSIRADINTLRTAAPTGASRGDILQFQATYRDVVLGEPSLAATLVLALQRFGEQDFVTGLERLKTALGQDIAAAQPSCAPARLHALLTDLFHFGVVSTVLDGCKALQTMLAQKYSVAGLQPVTLMCGLVELSGMKWVSAERFNGLSERCGAHATEAKVHFLSGIKNLLREMPENVFLSSEQRQSVINASQEALDTAIDREEEEY